MSEENKREDNIVHADTDSTKSKEKPHSVNTPYDDAFKTLTRNFPEMVLSLLNEVFGTNYTGREAVDFKQDEHHTLMEINGGEDRSTDSSFVVYGKTAKRYVVECQSRSDRSMVIRMAEYATQVAIEHESENGNIVKVEIPYIAVVYLRNSSREKKPMCIQYKYLEQVVDVPIKTLLLSEYTVDEIFSKNLMLLVPFIMFLHESKLKVYNNNKRELQKLLEEIQKVRSQILNQVEEDKLSIREQTTLFDMMQQVNENLIVKYPEVQKEVAKIMGGKVLELRYDRDMKEAEARGEKIGETNGISKMFEAMDMMKQGKSDEAIHEKLDLKMEYIAEIRRKTIA